MSISKTYDGAEPIRLNKWLAQSGVCSRREADTLIEEGCVAIAGETVRDAGRKILPGQTVTLDRGETLAMTIIYNKPIGIVTRNDVLQALAGAAGDTYVTEIMQREFLKLDASKNLQEARDSMAQAGTRIAAVFDGARYLGLISQEDIAEAFTLLTFKQRQRRAAPADAPAV